MEDSKQMMYQWIERIIILEIVREKSQQLKTFTPENKIFPIRKSVRSALGINDLVINDLVIH